ncbi:MAG: hypothetical protein JNL10_14375 [Verrucomicrobiales bacterium]|nr:hypothetical protein [Verrucomicrobiales bacterium]
MSYDDAHDPDPEEGVEEAYPDPEALEPDPAPAADSGANVLTLILAGSATGTEIGSKALLLAREVRHPFAPQTLRALATRMGCSITEAHRRSAAFRDELSRIRKAFRKG